MFRVPKRAKLEKDPREQNEAIMALLGPSKPEPINQHPALLRPSGPEPMTPHPDSSGPSPLVQVHELGPFNNTNSAPSSPAPFGNQPYASNAEVAGLPFESLADTPRDSYPGDQCDLDTGACQADIQADFTIPMDDDDDMVEPPFGVLSNPTFDSPFSCQPHQFGYSLDVQQDGHIVEDTGPAFVSGSAMEDIEMDGSQAVASMTMTEPPPPFSWVPPSVSGAFSSIFPSIPSAQMGAFGNSSIGVIEPPMVTDPCAVAPTLSQGITSQQAAPLQALPFVSERTHPSPSAGVELLKEPESFIPRLSPLFSSISPDHTTPFPSATPLAASGSGAPSVSADAKEINYSIPTSVSSIEHSEDEAEQSKYKTTDSNSYVIYALGPILPLLT